MVVKKGDFNTKLAQLLPEGLTEDLVNKIGDLISEMLEEKVNSLKETLTTKFTSFIRGNVEKLKEQAVKELELENQTFRDAQMFQSVKAMFAIENTAKDEDNAINSLTESVETQDNQLEVLTKEVDRLVRENLTLKTGSKVLKDQNTKLQESAKATPKPIKTSDKSIVVSSETFSLKESKKEGAKEDKAAIHGNELLTPDLLNAAKKMGIGK